jgi:ArsR family transcriptional regulator, arsenate/arsenite/antimonite-responsive transcriptional repressor
VSAGEVLAVFLYFRYDGNMEASDVVRSLAALAQPLRLQVFRALVVVGQSGLTPGTISEALGIPGATLSFHLKELTHAGLVTQARDGRHLIYRAAYDRMNALLGYLTQNCCQGAECLDETAVACKC